MTTTKPFSSSLYVSRSLKSFVFYLFNRFLALVCVQLIFFYSIVLLFHWLGVIFFYYYFQLFCSFFLNDFFFFLFSCADPTYACMIRALLRIAFSLLLLLWHSVHIAVQFFFLSIILLCGFVSFSILLFGNVFVYNIFLLNWAFVSIFYFVFFFAIHVCMSMKSTSAQHLIQYFIGKKDYSCDWFFFLRALLL